MQYGFELVVQVRNEQIMYNLCAKVNSRYIILVRVHEKLAYFAQLLIDG